MQSEIRLIFVICVKLVQSEIRLLVVQNSCCADFLQSEIRLLVVQNSCRVREDCWLCRTLAE